MTRPQVRGATVDAQTRCVHYHGPLDVIAIRFSCCDRWYPCLRCHDEDADHPIRAWSAAERTQQAVLCGVCGTTLRIADYLEVTACPSCGAGFNPGCALHHHIYFGR